MDVTENATNLSVYDGTSEEVLVTKESFVRILSAMQRQSDRRWEQAIDAVEILNTRMATIQGMLGASKTSEFGSAWSAIESTAAAVDTIDEALQHLTSGVGKLGALTSNATTDAQLARNDAGTAMLTVSTWEASNNNNLLNISTHVCALNQFQESAYFQIGDLCKQADEVPFRIETACSTPRSGGRGTADIRQQLRDLSTRMDCELKSLEDRVTGTSLAFGAHTCKSLDEV